jgi:F420-dependent oxidoreductase-like protein
VWTSETWGSDGAVLLAWIAAHTDRIGLGAGVLQMPARSPAAAAMAALTLDHLSSGRFRLGLGVSGPPVAEGWHGAPFDGPIARTREYVDIVRGVLRREAPVTAPGPNYPLPLPGGEGKALKPNVRPLRPDVPIYLAAMGPRNVALAAEIADGWIPFLYSPDQPRAFADAVNDGSSRRARDLADLDVTPMVPVAFGPDLGSARDELRPLLALYAGGMGSANANFYKDLVTRYGFGDAASAIQQAFLDGRRTEAAGLVPDAMIDELCWSARSNTFASASTPGGRRVSPPCSRRLETSGRCERSPRQRCDPSGLGRPDRPQVRVVPRALDRDVGVLAAFERVAE